jgi:hypothetical protein
METSSTTKKEYVADSLLAFIVLLPVLLFLVTSIFCSGWNEGSGVGTCSIPITGIYETFMGVILILSFGGIIFVLPFVAALLAVSVYSKIKKVYQRKEMWSALTIARYLYVGTLSVGLTALVVSVIVVNRGYSRVDNPVEPLLLEAPSL